MKSKPTKHVFICINCRAGKLKSCGDKGLAIRAKLKTLTLKEDLDNIRINKSGCLDLCEQGPAMVIYPNSIWYKKVKITDCQEIFERSIQNDDIIERLQLKNKHLED